MAGRLNWLSQAVTRVFEPVLTLPALAVLRWCDLCGPAPFWLLAGLLALFGVLQQPEVQRRLGSGVFRPGIALHMGAAGVIVYLIGWGPLLAAAFAVVATMHLRMSGGGAWRPALAWMLVAMGAGQAGIALGWVFCYLSPTLAQAAGFLGVIAGAFVTRAMGLSVEQREQAEAEVRRREERFRALVQDSTDTISVIDREGQVSYVSPAVRRVTGFSPEEMLGTGYSRWVYPDDLAVGATLIADGLADPGGEHRAEIRMRHADGDLRWFEVTLRNLLDNPAVDGLVVTFRDITERRAIQERLAFDASHDQLTGLANRAAFLRGLERAVADRHGARGVAVLFLDLDGFKRVNDTLGHRAGDALIVAVASILRRSVLGSDLVGRLGGDEFGIVLTGIASPRDAVAVAERILSEMDRPVLIAGQETFARTSIGVAIAGPGDTGADELLNHADIAMYSAKRTHAHSLRLYGAEPVVLG